MNFSWLLKIVGSAFSPVFSLLSKEIKSELENFIKDLYKKSEKTENVWDDFFVKMLADILNIDV